MAMPKPTAEKIGEPRKETTEVKETPTTTDEKKPTPKEVQKVLRFTVSGSVPVENYADLFRCFINHAMSMHLKIKPNVHFEVEVPNGKQLDVNDSALKAMQEAARQLGLSFKTEEKP